MTNPVNRSAIVIGGSIAGLLAARVLTDYFEQVTIIERDHLPQGAELRSGTPQASHGHALMLRGRNIMESLLPGLESDLIAAGTLVLDQSADAMIRFKGGWAERINSGHKVFSMSRPLLESLIRSRVLYNPQISVREGYEVQQLLTDADGKTVTGLQIRQRGGQETEILTADLVVDASGRTSKAPEWLEKIGYPQPKETRIDAFVGYATRWYEVPESHKGDWHAMWIQSVWPTVPRGGIILPIEGNRWQVTLFGVAKDYPPADEDAFLQYARTLASTRFYEAIKNAKPISPVHSFRSTVNRLRHYDKLGRFPEHLVVLGDAYCAFNPTYAQGMTVASIGAETLMQCLQESGGKLDGLSMTFQKRVAKAIAPAWMMTTTEDLRWETTEGGKKGLMDRVIHWYTDKVFTLISQDADIYRAFIPVQHMLKPPTSLFAPSIARKVLAYALRGTPKPQPINSTQEVKAVGAGD